MTTFSTTAQTGFTYSNGNLTAHTQGSTSWITGISTTSKSSGIWYFEMNADTFEGNDQGWGFGVCDGTNLGNFMGNISGTHGIMGDYANPNGDIWYNGSKNAGYTGTITGNVNERWGSVLDTTNSRIWFRNITRDITLHGGTPHWYGGGAGAGTDNPGTPSSGFSISGLVALQPLFIGVSMDASSAAGQATLVPSSAGFIGAVPSVATPWDPTVFIPNIDTRRNRTYLRR